jgi:lysophospholipase L1-like esterase
MKKTATLLSAILLTSALYSPVAFGKEKSTIVFGDSNTEGANWNDNHYKNSKKWANKLSLDRSVVNAGIAGNTIVNGTNRLKSVLNHNPQTVTIMFGTNDGVLRDGRIPKTSWKQFEKHLNYMVDTLQSREINVVLMTTVPVIEEGKGYFYSRHNEKLYSKYGGAREFQDKYNDITRKVARQQGVPLVDTYRTFLNYAGGDSDKALSDSGLMDKSGTHMSEYGAEVLYRTVNKTLEKNQY